MRLAGGGPAAGRMRKGIARTRLGDAGVIILGADTFDNRSTLNPASDGGTWTETNPGSIAVSGGNAHTTNGITNRMARDLGTLAQDVTWQLSMSTGPLTLASLLHVCLLPDATKKSIAFHYNGAAAQWEMGIDNSAGYTPFSGGGAGTLVCTPWSPSGSTVIRLVYLPATKLCQLWQNGALVYSHTLTTAEALGLGTWSGVTFRSNNAGEKVNDYLAVQSS